MKNASYAQAAILIGTAFIAHLLIWLSPSLTIQTLATLTLTALIPGVLLVNLLLHSTISLPERILYSIAAGYAVMVLGMLLLSYLPGGISQWQVLGFFDVLILLLALYQLRRDRVDNGEILRPTRSNLIGTIQEFPPKLSAGATTAKNDTIDQQSEQKQSARGRTWPRPDSLWLAALLLLLLAGSLRLTNIGYAEFHNDEARAALRAAAVIQGSEDVLFIHKKGPTEILIPAAVYALAGNLNETTGRLPFAIANLVALFGVWLLGWRLFGPGVIGHVAGFIAALLLTLDGYFIGFSRIVQYQSVVFMTTVLTVAIFARLWRNPQRLMGQMGQMGQMILAALFMVLGLLSHYEAGLAMLPVFMLLGGILVGAKKPSVLQKLTKEEQDDAGVESSISKNEHSHLNDGEASAQQQTEPIHAPRTTHHLIAIIVASAVGLALLALFYLPYLTHPQFSATYTYLAERRIGGTGLPYNNLSDVFLRTTVYSTSYYVGLMVLVTLLGLAVALRRGAEAWSWLSKMVIRVLVQLFAITLVLFVVNSTWLSIGGSDWAVLPFGLAFGLAIVLPRMTLGERTLWLWFGGLFLLAIFGTLKPRTHVYVFFIPWALLVGWVLAQLWARLTRGMGMRAGNLLGMAAIAIMAILFGNYAYRYFVQNQPEVLRTWEENRPVGYLTAYDEPDKRALFGFPSSNGWKVIGQLYAQGEIEGNFESNELEAWGPAWYTRGQVRCKHNADWYFQTVSNLEPFYEFQEVAMNDFLSKGFAPWGQVTVNGVHKMTIHKRIGDDEEQAADPLALFELNDYQADFDQSSAPDLALTYPVVNPPIANPLHINLAGLFWLEGYDIDHPQPLKAGDTIRLTLFWRAQQPTDKTYKVFNQSYYGEGTMIAQKDGHPVCGNRDTWQWDPGELITDVHEIPVLPDAPDGLYPLITGMYELDDGVRLEVIGEDGNGVGNQVHLTDIRIGVE